MIDLTQDKTKILYAVEDAAVKQTFLNFRSMLIIFEAILFIIRRPSYWKYIIGAILVNILVFLIVLASVFALFGVPASLIQNVVDLEFHIIINLILYFVFFIIAFFVAFLSFRTLSSIACGPIYDKLTDEILDEYKIEDITPNFGSLNTIYSFASSIKFEGKKLFLSISFFILTLILNSLPIAGNGLFAFLNYVNVITMNGVDIMNPSLSRSNLRFRDKLKFISSNPSIWPFLVVSGSINAIPILNILTIPITIVASAMIYVEVNRVNGTSDWKSIVLVSGN